MIPALSDQQTRMLRMRSQSLWPLRLDPMADANHEANSPAETIRRICGVQAQDLPSGVLSVRPRSVGETAAQVEQARQSAAIAWIWCMRGTLHLVATEDALWLAPLFGPALIAGDRRRLEQLGWNEASVLQGLRLVEHALVDSGALTRSEIRDLLAVHHLPAEGQAPVHLIYRATLEGLICYGPNRGDEPAFTRFDTWLGGFQPLPRPEALSRLARRYLAAYAPASPEDFASWSGLKMGEAREAWNVISDEITQVTVQGQPAWLLQSQTGWLDEINGDTGSAPLVRLLPRYDTYLLGYASRDTIVDPRFARRVHPGGGQISAALLVDGQAAGVWKTGRRKGVLEVHVEPFEPLTAPLLTALESEVDDLGRFLGENTALVVRL